MSNFTSPMVPITLERQDPSQPWVTNSHSFDTSFNHSIAPNAIYFIYFQIKGFRLQGGADYRLALSVKKVSQGTPAHQKLHPGDVIVAIQGNDVTTAPHALCNELIAGSGLTCQFTVRK